MRFQTADANFCIYEPLDSVKFDFVRENGTRNLITLKESYMVENKSLIDFSYDMRKYIGDVTGEDVILTGYEGTIILVQTETVMVILSRDRHRADEVIAQDTVEVDICAEPDVALALIKIFDGLYNENKFTKVHWWYNCKEGTNSISMVLKDVNKVHDEFYPWIEEGVDAYFKRYLDSLAPLLFVSGPAGVGKTSFLRHSICRNNLTTYVGYDHKLFDSDEMFISFISSSEAKIMIMEDAENIVLPRNKAGNSMMTRFLNVSDGLIKFPGKKIIFTTNESNFENIDSALIRPGRCFDFIEFRKLTFAECEIACNVAGLKFSGDSKEHALAELFNPSSKVRSEQTIGFR